MSSTGWWGFQGTIFEAGRIQDLIMDMRAEVLDRHPGILWWQWHRQRRPKTPQRRAKTVEKKNIKDKLEARLSRQLARKLFESKVRIRKQTEQPPMQAEAEAPKVLNIKKWKCACSYKNFGFRARCKQCNVPAPGPVLLLQKSQLAHIAVSTTAEVPAVAQELTQEEQLAVELAITAVKVEDNKSDQSDLDRILVKGAPSAQAEENVGLSVSSSAVKRNRWSRTPT